MLKRKQKINDVVLTVDSGNELSIYTERNIDGDQISPMIAGENGKVKANFVTLFIRRVY